MLNSDNTLSLERVGGWGGSEMEIERRRREKKRNQYDH